MHSTRRPPLALALLALPSLLLDGCSSEKCGPGTVDRDGVCAANENRTCGPDTVDRDGVCVAANERTCGDGTSEQGGVCVPSYPKRDCGPQTVEVAGHCVPDTNVGACSAGTVLRGDTCVAVALQMVSLPFPAGQTVGVAQGFNGYDSHYDDERYAVDFPVPQGTMIAAARGGVVWQVKEDSNTGCGMAACADQGNYVIIDHGDATFAYYYHLMQGGALVAAGDEVCAGQPIALSGNTGFSTGPHLHFEVTDPARHSLPLVIAELDAQTFGVPVAGGMYTSQNKAPATCNQTTQPSACPRDYFEPMGVSLDDDVPCATAKLDQSYPVSGKVLVPGAQVMVATFLTSTQTWAYDCHVPGVDGSFSTTLSWSAAKNAGKSFLMIGAADSKCSPFQGWHSSTPIALE